MSAEAQPPMELSIYRVLIAGSFRGSVKEVAALAGMGVTVRVVAQATPEARRRIEALPLDEAVFADSEEALRAEAFRRASSVNLVVLAGVKADMLERTLLPLLQECAVSSLDDLLPLVRLDDPSLRYLRTARRWGYYLVGRALGLPPVTARAYMEDCCGYEKQNQDRQ
ncbi:MAG: hypothetical protein U5J83_17450 [Bryobacterales bacterium]|nr:hypothetical protein [Bryobacterales bacterium]